MSNQHWFIRNSVSSLVATLVLAGVSGCGSTSSGPSDDSVPGSATEVPRAPEFSAVGETNSVGETLCSLGALGTDVEGRTIVEREIYNFGKMNEELARYPELAEGTGFSEVTDCEGARRYGERYRAFAAEHPNFRGEPTKAEAMAELLSDPANIGHPDPEGPEVEKVFGGSIGDRPSVVQIVHQVDFDKYQYCSATRISATVFITAAHCLPQPTERGDQSFQVYLKRRKSNGVEGWLGGATGKWLTVYARSHPNYQGLTSGDFDIAVVWFLKQHHALLTSETQFSNTTFLATRAPEHNDGQLIYGWGAENNSEAMINWRLRTPAPQGTVHGIDGVTAEAWNIEDTGPEVRMCTGDSGGAALRDGMLDGVTSLVLPKPAGGAICSELGKYQFWSRVDTKLLWLRQTIHELQRGSTKTPYRCVFHSGNPSDDMDYEHIVSYLDCNVNTPPVTPP